uniref:uncharacterized protein isoform X2 n=1 Tax=Myxine glutinosa TaxID=7769 RepID=UPI00358FEACF
MRKSSRSYFNPSASCSQAFMPELHPFAGLVSPEQPWAARESNSRATKRFYRSLSDKFLGSASAAGGDKGDTASDVHKLTAALFSAVEHQDNEILKSLLLHTSSSVLSVNVTNNEGVRPLDIAIMTNDRATARLLLRHGARESPQFAFQEFRFRHLATVVREAQIRISALGGQPLRRSAGDEFPRDISTMHDERTQLRLTWEQRLHLYQRMQTSFWKLSPPGLPTNVHLTVVAVDALRVTFKEAVSSHLAVVTKFRVQWSTEPGFKTLSGEAVIEDPFCLQYTIRNLAKGTKYYLRVAGYNMKGWGLPQASEPPCAAPSTWSDQDNITPRPLRETSDLEDLLQQARKVCKWTDAADNRPGDMRKSSISKSLKHLFQPSHKFVKSLKRGTYLGVLCYHGNSILVTMDEQVPLVEIDETCSPTAVQDFLWLAKVSCAWDDVEWMRNRVFSTTSSTPSQQSRQKLLTAVAALQDSLGFPDLGWPYCELLQDHHGNTLFLMLRNLVQPLKTCPTPADHQKSSTGDLPSAPQGLRWKALKDYRSRRKSFIEEPSILEHLNTTIQDKVTFVENSRRPLPPGLYVGSVQLRSSLHQLHVVTSTTAPNMLHHARVRLNHNVSREEWQWLQGLSCGSCCCWAQQQERGMDFRSQLGVAICELLHSLQVPSSQIQGYHLYTSEVFELGEDVSFLLLLPPSELLCRLPSSVHFRTYANATMALYATLFLRLEIEAMASKQAIREVLGTQDSSEATFHLNNVYCLTQRVEEAWQKRRWLADVLRQARQTQPSRGVPLARILGMSGGLQTSKQPQLPYSHCCLPSTHRALSSPSWTTEAPTSKTSLLSVGNEITLDHVVTRKASIGSPCSPSTQPLSNWSHQRDRRHRFFRKSSADIPGHMQREQNFGSGVKTCYSCQEFLRSTYSSGSSEMSGEETSGYLGSPSTERHAVEEETWLRPCRRSDTSQSLEDVHATKTSSRMMVVRRLLGRPQQSRESQDGKIIGVQEIIATDVTKSSTKRYPPTSNLTATSTLCSSSGEKTNPISKHRPVYESPNLGIPKKDFTTSKCKMLDQFSSTNNLTKLDTSCSSFQQSDGESLKPHVRLGIGRATTKLQDRSTKEDPIGKSDNKKAPLFDHVSTDQMRLSRQRPQREVSPNPQEFHDKPQRQARALQLISCKANGHLSTATMSDLLNNNRMPGSSNRQSVQSVLNKTAACDGKQRDHGASVNYTSNFVTMIQVQPPVDPSGQMLAKCEDTGDSFLVLVVLPLTTLLVPSLIACWCMLWSRSQHPCRMSEGVGAAAKVAIGGASITNGHTWRTVEPFVSPTCCGVCEQPVLLAGAVCDMCSLHVDSGCVHNADHLLSCKASTSLPSQDGTMSHLWVKVNISESVPCAECAAPCASKPLLCHQRCAWCQRVVHVMCLEVLHDQSCDFGPLQLVLLPPHYLHIAGVAAEQGEEPDLPNVDPEWSPLLVLTNRRSGEKMAESLLQAFRALLNPIQVMDLNDVPPMDALRLCTLFPCHVTRLLICGGDGTIGWVLDAVDTLREQGLLQSVPVLAVLPLGTGNDLARCLGWGEAYAGDDLPSALLSCVHDASPVNLDRWTVTISSRAYLGLRKPSCKVLSMNNYFSVGPDALMALNFHRHRERSPGLFTSRLLNKAVYLFYGTKDCLVQECKDLHKKVELELDGQPVELPALEGIIVLNIAYWGGGCRLWEGTEDGHCPPARQDDGKLEVVGVYGSFHLAQIQVKLANPLRLGQAHSVKLTLKESQMPMQVDGEPWEQGPCSVLLEHKTTARVLARRPRSTSMS